MKKHVLVLNQYALPEHEAGGTRHHGLFRRLQHWDYTIFAGALNHYTQAAIDRPPPEFKLFSIPPHPGAGPRRITGWIAYAAKAALQGVRQRHVDVVYASTPQMFAPLAGIAISRLRRVPLVLEIRDLWPETLIGAGALRHGSFTHSLLVRLERFLYSHADHIVTVTPGWENHLRENGARATISVIPNGADPIEAPLNREAVRRKHGFNGITAVYAGAHGPANGLERIVEAATELPEVHFVLIGDGSQKSSLRATSETCGLTNLHFREPMPRHELLTLLTAADIGIHTLAPIPVLKLGLSPNKIFDYMAAALPIVSNAGSGLSTIVTPDVGHLGENDTLIDGLRKLAQLSSEQRRAMGLHGQSHLLSQFSREASAQRLEGVLELVCPNETYRAPLNRPSKH